MNRDNLNLMPAAVKPDKNIKVKSTSLPDNRPDFHTWCREFKVSTLYNRVDHWLDFELDRPVLFKERN